MPFLIPFLIGNSRVSQTSNVDRDPELLTGFTCDIVDQVLTEKTPTKDKILMTQEYPFLEKSMKTLVSPVSGTQGL